MTREEAREVLKDWDGYFIGHSSDDVNEALNMAIKALEQEPITKNDLGVLDKVRAEIETKYGQCDICEYFEDYDFDENDISEYRPIGDIADILQIIDKYKAEIELQESEVEYGSN